MTLLEFSDKCFSCPKTLNKTTYVFTDEYSAAAFAEGDIANYEIFMTIKSQMRPCTYATEKVCNAEVQMIYAFDKDTFGVVIDL